MWNLLSLAIFILTSPGTHAFLHTTQTYDEQYQNIQDEFKKLFDDSKKDFVSQGEEFVLSLIRNRTHESLTPITLSHYCLLQTIWALASGNVELAETYANQTECKVSEPESWLENFQFDTSFVFDVVKTTSTLKEGKGMFKRIAVSLSRNYNVLLIAAERADDSLIIWLKNSGLDLSLNGIQAVGAAWQLDHVDTVSLLMEMGAFGDDSAKDVVHLNNSRGETLLHFAADKGMEEIALKLLNDGAEVDHKDAKCLTPLYHAMRAGDVEMAGLLIDYGADIWTRSHNGNTLLHLAVIENSSVTISCMRKFYNDLDPENNEGATPLFLAAERGYNEIVELLIQSWADPNRSLHLAINKISLIAAKILIKYGASVNSTNKEDLTPLYVAANLGNLDLIFLLLNKGAVCRDKPESLLHIAARRGDITVIESLVSFCVPVDELNEDGVTPLYSAASAGQRPAMDVLLYFGADLYITLKNGWKLLHVAAAAGDLTAMQSLLDVGISVDVKDTDMLSGLCRAVQTDNIASVELLIEKGANTSFRTPVGDTLLHLAVASNSYKSIRHLVELGLYIDSENYQSETPLYFAAKNENTEVVNLLISLGANKNHVTSKGGTLAHLAAEKNDVPALITFFNIGVDFNSIDRNGSTPLYIAIRKTEYETARLMLESGADLFFINRDNGQSLLHIAGRDKDHKAIDFLIERGIHVDFKGSNGSRPIDVALFNGNCDTAEYFIKKGANFRGRNGMNRTILHSAVIGNCKTFLENIAVHIDNIDPKDQNMQTPLHLAALLGRSDISATLVSLGADVNSLDKYNSTPFQIAATNRDWMVVSYFLKRDVNLDWTDSHKRNLLHLVTLDGWENMVQYLTKNLRVNVYVKDMDGRIPLHLAVKKDLLQIIRYLVDERVPKRIDEKDNEGKTPLHLAAIGGNVKIVKYLLEKGADPQEKDHIGQTPLIYAAKQHNWEVIKIIKNKLCSFSSTNSTDELGRTVLHLAVLDEQINLITSNKRCLKALININDSKKETPLDLAISLKKWNIVKNFFIHYRSALTVKDCMAVTLAEVGFWEEIKSLSATELGSECRDERNRTLLHLAAIEGDEEAVISLIKKTTVDLDAMDVNNRTALHLAAIKDQYKIVRILLQHGARSDVVDKNHFTPLTAAITHKSWAAVRQLLGNVSHVDWSDVCNRTILHNAAVNGQKDMIEYLLKNTKIDVNAKDANSDTTLQLVAVERNLSSHDRQDIMDDLIVYGADWNILDKQKRNILHLVTISGDVETLKYIIGRYRLDINGQDVNSRTPLHTAIINGHHNMVDTLLDYGADRNLLEINNYTPLVYAIKDRFDAVNLLDEHRYIDWSDSNNRSILHLAAMHGCPGVVGRLLNSAINVKKNIIDRVDINGQTPLHLAALKDESQIVEVLLRKGANAYSLDKEKLTPLDLAVFSNSWKAVEILTINGYYVEHKYASNRTLLHVSIMNGLRGIINNLINNEITDLQVADIVGDTPMHFAARKNDVITLQQLLDNGVSRNLLNNYGQSPLTEAMASGSWEAVGVLLKDNCDVEVADGNNRTLLHYAAMNGKKEIIDHLFSCRNVDINALDNNNETALDLLLRNNSLRFANYYSDINWRDGKGRSILHFNFFTSDFIGDYYRDRIVDAEDNEGQTPLHIASSRGDSYKGAQRLLDRGASINKVDIQGHSPLHLAAMHGHGSFIKQCLSYYNDYNENFYMLDVVKYLRLNARDLLGRTPLQLALDNGHEETANLLKRLGAII